MDAAALDRLDGSRFDFGMRRQAEIVLRSEIDAAHRVAAVVLCRANRLGAVFRSAGERPQAILPAHVLPAEKAFGATEQVRPAGNAKIPHAASERARRNLRVRSV